MHLQQLAAPRRVIGTQPYAIQRQAKQCINGHRFADVMLGADRGDMRVVMLHGDQRQAAPRCIILCKLGTVKIGVQVMCHDLGLHIESIA